jgi:hypothetical protein
MEQEYGLSMATSPWSSLVVPELKNLKAVAVRVKKRNEKNEGDVSLYLVGARGRIQPKPVAPQMIRSRSRLGFLNTSRNEVEQIYTSTFDLENVTVPVS